LVTFFDKNRTEPKMITPTCKLRFSDTSQTRWSFLLKRVCEVMTAKKRFNNSWIAELSTLWYVGFQPFS
jgi:hypothetical protein